MIEEHLQKIRESLAETYTLGNLSDWIKKHTKINDRHYSYKGREYQKDIIDNEAHELYVTKAAQTGLTEVLTRWILAAVVTQPNLSVAYTMPTATDAQLFAKARLDPMIAGSKLIRDSLSKTVNSVDLKQFGANSFIYTRGTISEAGALSIPLDILVHDEVDRSSMDNLAAYVSRLQMKPTKMRRMFSTPTVSKYGISALVDVSKRHVQLWKCSHCNHTFLPDFELHVVVPEFSGQMREITKANIKDIRWRDAYLACPSCGGLPSTHIKYRQWVLENPLDNFDAISYSVSPFCAPDFITVPYMVQSVARFGKYSEFRNQVLGLTAEDSDDNLTEKDLRAVSTPTDMSASSVHIMGVDFGTTCHIVIGRVQDGLLLIVHREAVFYTKLEQRRTELCQMYRVLVSVHDLLPYTDMVTRIVDRDPNAYAAIYVSKASTETHYVKEQVADAEENKLNVRSAMVNRNVAFDALMNSIKRKEVVIYNVDDELVSHCTDMKRIQKFNRHGGMEYVWEKSSTGVDHYYHSLLYCYIASKLLASSFGFTPAGSVPLLTAFRPKGG